MRSTDSPLVSVIVPVYNVEKFLKECVNSILAQTYDNLEIILVDDGSPDSSGKMCDEFAEKDGRIKVVHKSNSGLNLARKSGFEVSTGEWITFVDSDDVIDERYVLALMEACRQRDTEVSVCGFKYFQEDIEKDIADTSFTFKNKDETTRLYLTDTRPENKFFLQIACAKLFRRRLIESVDWAACDYRSNEDEFMSAYYYRDIQKGVSFVDNQLYYYRQNPESITSKGRSEYKNSYKGEDITKLDFLNRLYDWRFAMFGEKYQDEIAFFFSMHFMIYINEEYRKKPEFRLSPSEKALYNNRLDIIRQASKTYHYHDEYSDIYKAIDKAGTVEAFFEYRECHPLVSIIVPIYNVERYLEECFNSLLRQTYKNIEIVAVDDGATDRSGGICDTYARLDERIRVIHKENGGVSTARNVGIVESRGMYVVFADADDVLADDAIEVLVEAATGAGQDILIISDLISYHTQGYFGETPVRSFPKNEVVSGWQGDENLTYMLLSDINSACNKLYARNALMKYDIRFPEDLRIAEDLVFVVKALLRAKGVLYTGKATYYYRTDFDNETSAMGTVSNNKAFDFGKALKVIEGLLRHDGANHKQTVSGFKRAVVTHSLYGLNVTEKDPIVHKKVFRYVEDDLFKHFNIRPSDAPQDEVMKVKMIQSGEYEKYIICRLSETKQYLFNRLNAVGYLKTELDKRTRKVESLEERISQLEGEMAYLRSPRGMVHSPLSRVRRKLQRIISRQE